MLIENSKKIVLKLGSSTVIDNKGAFKKEWVSSLIKDIKKYGKNKDFVIVSSGAIALGQKYLKIKKKKIKLDMSQAIAAIGQIHLAVESFSFTIGIAFNLNKLSKVLLTLIALLLCSVSSGLISI